MVVDSTFCRISYAGGTGIVGHGRKNIDALEPSRRMRVFATRGFTLDSCLGLLMAN